MKKFMLAASACFAAMLIAPAAQASVSINCPGFSGLGVCTFSQSNSTGAFGDSFASAQGFTDLFQLNLSSSYKLSITATNTAATGGPISFTTAALLDSSFASIGNIAFGAVPTTWTLAAGTYYMSFNGSTQGSASYGGTIDVRPAVPEPATWALMIGGLALAGTQMRRRKAAVSFA